MIHEAGEYVEGVQRCARCGFVLVDYRDSMMPSDQLPPKGFAVGTSVEVEGLNPRFSTVVVEPPDCVKLH